MIKLTFNPFTNPRTKLIFKNEIVSKFYVLWKSSHLTSESFIVDCKALCKIINYNLELFEIEEFIEALQRCRLASNSGIPNHSVDVQWVIKHWDYFNPNIRKSLKIEHFIGQGRRRSEKISIIN